MGKAIVLIHRYSFNRFASTLSYNSSTCFLYFSTGAFLLFSNYYVKSVIRLPQPTRTDLICGHESSGEWKTCTHEDETTFLEIGILTHPVLAGDVLG